MLQPLPSVSLPARPLRARDLRDLGLNRHDVRALVAAGELVQPFTGVFVLGHHVDVPEVRAAALALVLPEGAAVATDMAAWLYGIDCRAPGGHRRPPDLYCVVPSGLVTPPRREGVRARQARLPEGDVVEHLGIPVTSPERTVIDLARYLPTYMGLGAADAFTHRGLVDRDVVRGRVEEWAGERWIDRARRVLALCDPRAESFGESWLRLRIVEAGFPCPEPQIWITDGDGVRLYRLDMGWPELKVAIEYDGVEYHSSEDQLEHDSARREDLGRRFGWSTYGVGKGLVLGRSLQLERAVGELLGLEPAICTRRW